MTNNFQVKPNAIFMITDQDGLPLLMRNTHDFGGNPSLPRLGEILMCLFARPLFAMRHIAERGGPQGYCFSLETQGELDPLLELLRSEGITRIHMNPCLISNEPHNMLFSLRDLNNAENLEELVSSLNKNIRCPSCHDEQKLVSELGGTEIIGDILYLEHK